MKNIAFLASYNGSAARAITRACKEGTLPGNPRLLVTNNKDSGALLWAKDAGLRTAVINKSVTEDPDQTIATLFQDNAIDLVICSGYMKLIGPKTIASVPVILNIHPALLPKHGGKGLYGRHVHQAVLESGDIETGITIHVVNGEYDKGKIIAQKTIPVLKTDTVEDIEEKVKSQEADFFVETLRKILA